MRKVLPLFSYLCHPVFIPIFATLYYFLIDGGYLSFSGKLALLAQIVILTVLIPITLYFLLRSLGKVDSIMVKDIGQRRFPLVAQALLFFLILQQSIPMHHTPELYFFFLGAFLTTILSLISVFLRFKSSLHMAGMGGLVFFVIGLSLHNAVNIVNTVAFLFAISGLVAASRLQMRAHSQPELWVGFLLGMAPQLLLWSFWL